jgi:hypothetical protein
MQATASAVGFTWLANDQHRCTPSAYRVLNLSQWGICMQTIPLGMTRYLVGVILTVLTLSAAALEGGTPLASGVFPAVGRVNDRCTGTLIEDRRVLTAAHCVCIANSAGVYACQTRARFEFVDIFLATAPGSRVTVRVDGNVRVHPEFGVAGWLREDLAVIELDQPASKVAPGIAPIPVENPTWLPSPGTALRLVGFGPSGVDCSGPSLKRMLDITLLTAESARLMSRETGKRVCPGDSGGPMLNTVGHVAGVTSWTGDEINGRPTHANFNFIFDLPRPKWTDCQWVEVGAQRSHQVGTAWCPNGSFMTQLDLDGDRSLAAHDAPVVGRARCCRIAQYYAPWGQCHWSQVGAQRSIEPDWTWCNDGDFLVAVDLDGDRSLPARAAPVVGQALCCRAQSGAATRWGSTYREVIGMQRSHQSGAAWCPDGSFLTRFELGWTSDVAEHDAPYVTRATCARPRQ